MRIYGLDFTSAPSRAKPITLAAGELGDRRLRVAELLRIPDFPRFERSLEHPGPWVAGMDFPFGQPRRLVEALSWPRSWDGVVELVSTMSRSEFEDLLLLYKAARPAGDKEHLRATDRLAGSLSPMKLYGVPLAKMYFEGAGRLLRTGLNIQPCRPTEDPRTVVEAYPGLAARRLAGRRSYKEDARRKETQSKRDARRDIVAALRSGRVEELYGFRVEMSRFLADELVADRRGDLLDAVLAAVQAAWASTRRERSYGIPRGADRLEGWIVDAAASSGP